MDKAQQAAYVNAMTTAAYIEALSMTAANVEREQRGHAPAYDEEAFLNLITKYGIHHNQILEMFHDTYHVE